MQSPRCSRASPSRPRSAPTAPKMETPETPIGLPSISAFTGPVVLGSPNQWFNPNAFTLPPFGTYGNLGRATLTGPGLATLDLSLFKTAAVSEKVGLQLRAEFFNLLNHANFGPPNATVFTNGTTTASTTPAIGPTAGLITATAPTARQIQLGLKLIF